MDYSLNKLVKTSDVDTLVQMANKELDDLTFKKTSLTRRRDNYTERFGQLEVDLATVNSEIQALATVLPELAESDTREEMENKKRKLEYRKFLLEERSEDYGAIALLEKEMEINLVDQQLEEVNVLIAQLETRKTELEAV